MDGTLDILDWQAAKLKAFCPSYGKHFRRYVDADDYRTAKCEPSRMPPCPASGIKSDARHIESETCHRPLLESNERIVIEIIFSSPVGIALADVERRVAH